MTTSDRHAIDDEFGAIVLGAGAGGLTAAVGLAKFGKRVALVERDRVGGECTNVGCVPSKTLIHLLDTDATLSPSTVLERVRARRDRLMAEETAWIDGMDGVSLLRGTARFASRHEVDVQLASGGTHRIRGRVIVLATGSRPARVTIEGLPEARTLTNESLFELMDAPRHLAIIGAGAVGCEMAFAFRRLGADVSVIQRSGRILSRLEPDVAEAIQDRMRREGIRVLLEAEAEHYHEPARTLSVRQEAGTTELVGVERVLMAVGRRPNVDLGLEHAGVRWTPRGVPVDGMGRSNVGHVRAVGDVTGDSATTHAANALARRAVRGIALPWIPAGTAPVLPAAVFTSPEVAYVGPPSSELRSRYAPELIRTLRVELRDTDRGYTMGVEDGFVLVNVLRFSGRVLSATIVAPAAGEMIPLLTVVVQRSLGLWALSRLVFPYPVLSEAIKKAADEFVFDTLAHAPRELAAYLRLRWRRPRAGRGGTGAKRSAPPVDASERRAADPASTPRS